jgi:putative hydrolases of HD superfamily
MTAPPKPSDDLDAIASLLTSVGRLKSLRRQGWVDRGVNAPESVSDHSFRLALMALIVGSRDPDIDTNRAVRIALVHDLPEAIAGDITPFDEHLVREGVDRDALFRQAPAFDEDAHAAKTESERRALVELTAGLPDELSVLLTETWEEYEAGETAEAKLVRQLDKLETWLQALEYVTEQPEVVIESFRLGTDRDVTDPELRALLDAINRLFPHLRSE